MNIQEQQQKMQEILKDTIDYYRKDPEGRRAVDNSGDCLYTTVDGRHCAIGRHMRPEFQTTEFDENNGVGVNGLDKDIDYYLTSNVLGLDEFFWRDLQDMHDIVGNWYRGPLKEIACNGLSEIGRERYVAMQDRIARGEYHG